MSCNNISSGQQISLAPKSEIPMLFFPHWVECPYRFHVRLVWAALMDFARRKRTLLARKIEDLTGLSDNTIRLAVRTLAKDNLCTIQKGKRRTTRIDLIEPANDAKYWASKDGEGWLNQIAYTMIGFPPGLPAIYAVLLGKVAALKGRQSYRGLAEMLGLKKRSVKKSLDALVALDAIRVGSLPDGYFTIDVAEMHPSIKANGPFVNNPSSASESRSVAELAPDRASLTTEMFAEMHARCRRNARRYRRCVTRCRRNAPKYYGY